MSSDRTNRQTLLREIKANTEEILRRLDTPPTPTTTPPVQTDPSPGWDWVSPIGDLHRATPARPVKRVVWNPPEDAYTAARLTFYLKRGPWADDGVNSRHNVCWWTVGGRNSKMLSYVNFVEDHRQFPKLFLRHGIDIQGHDQTMETRSYGSVQDKRVKFTLTWDGSGEVFTTTDEGFVIGNLQANVPQFVVDSRGVVADFGFTGTDNPNEPAGLGWEWGDWQLALRRVSWGAVKR